MHTTHLTPTTSWAAAIAAAAMLMTTGCQAVEQDPASSADAHSAAAPAADWAPDRPVEVYSHTPSTPQAVAAELIAQENISTASTSWGYPFNPTSWSVDFNVTNPALTYYSSCYNTSMSNLTHAGEDWAGSSTQVIAAIGDGTVVYAGNANYPGYVVVIEHALTSAQRSALGISSSYIYSMYGHLDFPYVSAGNTVVTGQAIGDLVYQPSNTHLHWEIRTFGVSNLCGTWYPGPGYTAPGTNALNYGYLDPTNTVAILQSAGNGGGCTCYQGLDFDRRPVDPADTHCGFRVCGTTYTLFECGGAGWSNLGISCGGGCTCYGGTDSNGRSVDPADTHCGYRVCGLDNQYYDCQSGGWVGSGQSCQ
ncbi:MAG: hypothetical protein Tsb0020_37310 [Haliangiales bacterium]